MRQDLANTKAVKDARAMGRKFKVSSRLGAGLLLGLCALQGARADQTVYFYDALGRVIGTTATAGQQTAYTYDAADNRSNLQSYTIAGPSSSSPSELHANQTLLLGQTIKSSDGRFTLALQYDGNLALFQGRVPYWSTRTGSKMGAALTMQGDGNLVLNNPQIQGIWSSGTQNNPGAKLVIQPDGNLIIYSTSGASLWSSNTCCR